MNSLNTNFNIFRALLSRDIYIIKQKLISIWINTTVVLTLEILLFGYLIPLMGLPATMIAPIFLGAAIGQTFFKITSKSFESIRDIHFSKFIEYRLTLPISKRWLFSQIICSWIIETLIGIVPFILIGIMVLHKFFSISPFGLFKGLIFYLLVTIMMCILALASSYYYEYSWFMHNIWPRRYGFLYALCPFYFIWQTAYTFSPRVAQLLLLNPFTYCVEGFRSAMLESDQFIAAWISAFIIIVSSSIALWALKVGIQKDWIQYDATISHLFTIYATRLLCTMPTYISLYY